MNEAVKLRMPAHFPAGHLLEDVDYSKVYAIVGSRATDRFIINDEGKTIAISSTCFRKYFRLVKGV